MSGDVLGRRALNRATLERQLLLRRAATPVLAAVGHLVGLQAQLPLNPYVGLWSRLDGFGPDDLGGLLADRAVVRVVAMRATLHLVTADDCLGLRPLVQPALDRELARHREHAPALRGVDLDPVLAFARRLLAERPRTGAELRAAMAERFPGHDPAALAYACRNRLVLVQVPPRGLWGRTGPIASTTAEAWLGRAPGGGPSVDDMVLRYLAAFGPATVADVATWSGLTGLAEVVDRLRPGLRAFTDERGRRLVDLPDAPRPEPDTPAPPRFLPEFDNVLLSHADRSRVVDDEHKARLLGPSRALAGSVLHDGFLCGTWRVERDGAAATLVVDHAGRARPRVVAELEHEGDRLVRFLAEDADAHDVRVVQGP